MHHFVPDFDTDDDYVNNPNSSSLNLPRKSIVGDEDDDLMELLWHNGQVVVQNQRLNNNNNTKKPSSSSSSPPKLAPSPCMTDQNLFIQEDEMSSWLHYPLQDDDFCSDLLFSGVSAAPPTAPCATTQVTVARPPVAVPVRNFMNFSRLRGNFNGRVESGPLTSKAIVRESTQVSPSATPSSAAVSESGLTRWTNGTDSSAVARGGHNRKGKAVATIPGASSSKSEIEPEKTIVVDERKRKEREATEETKEARGSTTSTKRSRVAEVHNISERKRRDRINERMKALQELIPRCNKSDKASMLDEAIEYMKSLQLQIQMMSMGCCMMPIMYTGMQQYMPMGINQPSSFMPFPNMLAAQRPLPTQTHTGGSGLHYPLHASDPSRVFVPNHQCDQPLFPGYLDPYQQFRSVHSSQPPQIQNQATSYPSSSMVGSSKESEDQGNHTTG